MKNRRSIRRLRPARLRPARLRPAQLVAAAFFSLILVGTALLMLPASSVDGSATAPRVAFFTSTSAVSLTGLALTDIGTHWSIFGQAIILGLVQISGFGILSLTSLATYLITGRMRLQWRINTAAEGRVLGPRSVTSLLIGTLVLTLLCEGIAAALLTFRLITHYHQPWGAALWEGTFTAISAFNNAGFGLRSDSLMSFVADAWIILPIAGAIILGGLGFPVLFQLVDAARARFGRTIRFPRITITAKMVLVGTFLLLLGGMAVVLFLEWNRVLAGMSLNEKILAAFFQSVTPRTAGFSSLDYEQMHPSTLMATNILMFIGGGSAGTAGGVKITTAVVLLAAMAAHVRGIPDTEVAGRTISSDAVRQAVTVAGLGVAAVTSGLMLLRFFESSLSTDQLAFEVFSAFGTVGLTVGVTPHLSTPSQLVLCLLMYLGRIGPLTLVTALAARQQRHLITLPMERPFIG